MSLQASLPAWAENQLTDYDRQIIARQQAARDNALRQARARCIALRGVDCDSVEGLREWLLLDRTREEAVLDQIRPGYGFAADTAVPSSGSGATTPAPGR